MKAAHSATEIAKYLLWRVAQERPEDPDYLTPLKLQKLLYYVQGWHLAQNGKPAFSDQVRAWRDGPVVESVYQEYRRFGKRAIDDIPDAPPGLLDETRTLVEHVWSRYKAFSAFKLSDMAHEESPWKKARGDLPRSAPSDIPIPCSDLEHEFKDQIAQANARLKARAKQLRAAAERETDRATRVA